MVRSENLQSKLAFLKRNLSILEGYRKIQLKLIVSDVEKKGALERYLFLACQAAIDIAEMVCKLQGIGKPTTMAEAFELLRDEKIIDKELSSKLLQMVGFRNYLTHGYEKISEAVVQTVLDSGLDDLSSFVKVIDKLNS